MGHFHWANEPSEMVVSFEDLVQRLIFAIQSSGSTRIPTYYSVFHYQDLLCLWLITLILFNRESQVVKGNCLLALTGLAVAVTKYANSLSSDTEEGPEVS